MACRRLPRQGSARTRRGGWRWHAAQRCSLAPALSSRRRGCVWRAPAARVQVRCELVLHSPLSCSAVASVTFSCAATHALQLSTLANLFAGRTPSKSTLSLHSDFAPLEADRQALLCCRGWRLLVPGRAAMVGRHAHNGGRRDCKLCCICICAGDPGDAARRAEHNNQVRSSASADLKACTQANKE